MKAVIKKIFNRIGYDLHKTRPGFPKPWPKKYGIPDEELYTPLFSPWRGEPQFLHYFSLGKAGSLVSADRCYVLYTLAAQSLNIDGDFWECGVYKGGTAAMLARLLLDSQTEKKLRLFDTFSGMPKTDPDRDLHLEGDFDDTSLEEVKRYVDAPEVCQYHKGLIPETFEGLENNKIAFAHVDVDIYSAVKDSIDFIYPRLSVGGFIIFDDYGFPSCPGARQAVDEAFSDLRTFPLCLPTGQAVVFKSFKE